MPYEIFICYKRITAADFAAHLKSGLEEFGYKAFLDTADIPTKFRGNEKWFEFRNQALLESKILLLIVTFGIERSEEVRKELALAMENKKEIMCLRYTDVDTHIRIDLGLRKIDLENLNQIPFDTKEDLLRKAILHLQRKSPSIHISRPSYIDQVAKYPPPLVDFQVTQIIMNNPRNRRILPDIGFNLSNLNDYPIKAKVRTGIHLGTSFLGSINSEYYNGTTAWNVNPNHTVFGHFSVPKECVDSIEKLSIQIDTVITVPNGLEYEFLPVSWSYLREENEWFFEPKSMESGKANTLLNHEPRTDKKMAMMNRIREDLTLLRAEIALDLENEAFQSRDFPTDVFETLQKDLMIALNMEVFRAIQLAYSKIKLLSFRCNLLDVNKRNYKEAIDHIDKALVLLT